MDKRSKKLRDYLKEDPDRNFIAQEETLYYCRSCLSTKVVIAITGFIYCGNRKCNKLLDHFDNIANKVTRL